MSRRHWEEWIAREAVRYILDVFDFFMTEVENVVSIYSYGRRIAEAMTVVQIAFLSPSADCVML